MLRVLFVAQLLEEELEETLWALKEYFEAGSRCECSRAFCRLGNLPAEELVCVDCVMLMLSGREELSQWHPLADSICQQGAGVVAIEVDAGASPVWTSAQATPGAEGHPILRQAPALVPMAEGPAIQAMPQGAQVMLTSAGRPVAWSSSYATTGLFFARFGHVAGLNRSETRQLLRGALEWSAGRRQG